MTPSPADAMRFLFLLLVGLQVADAFTLLASPRIYRKSSLQLLPDQVEFDTHQATTTSKENANPNNKRYVPAVVIPTIATAAPCFAYSASADAIPSALAAYGHYLGLVLVAMCLITERLLVKPGMSVEDEKTLGNVDIAYGLAGTLVLVSGYFRATQYGKGWEFYAHEPLFWVKMTLFSIMGSASFFPTTKIIQRAIAIKNAEDGKEGCSFPEPMSEKLAGRMKKIINGEILALASIPLMASLMSRGVLYADNFPWQVGAGAVGLSVFGLGAKYIKEALDFVEDTTETTITGNVYGQVKL